MNSIWRVPRIEARAALLSLSVGIVLLVVKFVAYFLTGSAVIFSDALESIVNVVGSAISLGALIYAHRPADPDHPYGHGKIEFVSAGFSGGLIVAAGVIIVATSAQRLLAPQLPQDLEVGLILIAAAMLTHTAVGAYLVRVGRLKGSITLEADGRHLLSDAITSVVALVGLGAVALTHLAWLDPAAAILVALYITITGVHLMRRSVAGLLDEQDVQDTQLLRSILDAHVAPANRPAPTPPQPLREPMICGYHKLRHRHSGRYHWVDFHITVPPTWDIAASHAAASRIEHEIEQALGEADATAHLEPCTREDCRVCRPVLLNPPHLPV